MLNESIADAIKSVLGEYASSEKVKALDAALRPIYGREALRECDHAAMMAEENGLRKAKSRTGRDKAKAQIRGAEQIGLAIRTAFGVTDND